MASNHKGHRREREIMDKLVKEGMIVHRVAGSGRGEDAICDLIAVDKEGKVQAGRPNQGADYGRTLPAPALPAIPKAMGHTRVNLLSFCFQIPLGNGGTFRIAVGSRLVCGMGPVG